MNYNKFGQVVVLNNNNVPTTEVTDHLEAIIDDNVGIDPATDKLTGLIFNNPDTGRKPESVVEALNVLYKLAIQEP